MIRGLCFIAVLLLGQRVSSEHHNGELKKVFLALLQSRGATDDSLRSIEETWDGTPDTRPDFVQNMVKGVKFREQYNGDIIIFPFELIVKYKDQPMWKPYFYRLVEALVPGENLMEQLKTEAPDTIPADSSTAAETFRRAGFPGDLVQGLGELAVWARTAQITPRDNKKKRGRWG